MKNFFITVIIILVIISIGITGFMFYAITTGNFSFEGDNLELVNTQSLSLNDIDSVKIKYISESVHIYESDSDEIVVKEYMNKNDEKYLAQIDQSGDNLTIKHGARSNILLFFNARIEIFLPSSYHGKLDLHTTSGSIKSDLAFEQTNFTASSVSGSLKFNRLNAPSIHLSNTSGSIKIQEAQGKIDASTISGSIKIEGGNMGGNFTTTSGSIKIHMGQITSDIHASSISGSVKFQMDRNQSFNFKASSISGSIKTFFEDELSKTTDRKFSGTVGTAPEYDISLDTTSGSIKIEKN